MIFYTKLPHKFQTSSDIRLQVNKERLRVGIERNRFQ